MSGTMAGDYNPNMLAQLQQQLMQGGTVGGGPALGTYQNVVLHEAPLPSTFLDGWRAHFRALRLLWKHLTPEQRGQYKLFCQGLDHEGRSFIVRGNRSGDHFRIFENGSTLRLRDQHRFCLVLTGEAVPIPDMLLAKKLLLERDEGLFLATANDLSNPNWPVSALPEAMRRILEAQQHINAWVPPPAPTPARPVGPRPPWLMRHWRRTSQRLRQW